MVSGDSRCRSDLANGRPRDLFWYPVGLGIAGSLQFLVVAGFSASILVLIAIFLAASCGLGYRLTVRHAVRRREARAEAPGADDLKEICARSCSVWARQIDSSRATANEAVHQLTEAFKETVARLDASLDVIRRTLAEIRGESGAMDTVVAGETELRRAMQALVSAQREKEGKVTGYTRDLTGMADDVRKIAMQIRLLSFNAAVEAARAGEAAGGFAVVAAEMRQLAAVSGETATGMIRKVEVINATMQTLVRDDKSVADMGAFSIGEAEAAINKVMQRFGQLASMLSEAVKAMETKTEEVHRDVSDALIAMQFQDRVSQIQEHVVRGLKELLETVTKTAAGAPDLAAWERRIASDFSTSEEFTNLRGAPLARAHGRRGQEITYF